MSMMKSAGDHKNNDDSNGEEDFGDYEETESYDEFDE